MEEYNYRVERTTGPVQIDADWNKNSWANTRSLIINNYMGDIPDFKPVTEAKMLYDDSNLYVIFRVQDRYVRYSTTRINGPVWKDSCVEFFFAPDLNFPGHYFNLEVNCCGTVLMHYNTIAGKEHTPLGEKEIRLIAVAASLNQAAESEMTEPVTWFIECRIPLAILVPYAGVTKPLEGVRWRANFFKIAEETSNPHYITWAPVKSERPDFHRPDCFGNIVFS